MIKVELDRECWSCSGTGKRFEQNQIAGHCDSCHGTGRSFTDAGIALSRFLETHYSLTRKPQIESS